MGLHESPLFLHGSPWSLHGVYNVHLHGVMDLHEDLWSLHAMMDMDRYSMDIRGDSVGTPWMPMESRGGVFKTKCKKAPPVECAAALSVAHRKAA